MGTGHWVDDLREVTNSILPAETKSEPNGAHRRGAIQVTVIANNQNIVLDGITYTFVTALGSPAASNVHVKIQGALADSMKTMAKAMRGDTDAANIAYGTGSQTGQLSEAYYTNRKVCLTTQLLGGNNIYFVEKLADQTAAFTLTSTTTNTIIAMARHFVAVYTFSLNSTSVASDWAVVRALLDIDTHDLQPYLVSIEDVSSGTTYKEFDLATSTDEATFTVIVEGVACNKSTTRGSLKTNIACPQVDAGQGIYIRFRSDGSSNSETVAYKVAVKHHIA